MIGQGDLREVPVVAELRPHLVAAIAAARGATPPTSRGASFSAVELASFGTNDGFCRVGW